MAPEPSPNRWQTGFQRLWEFTGTVLIFVVGFLGGVLGLLGWLSSIHLRVSSTLASFPPSDAKRPVDSTMVRFEGLVLTSKGPRGCSDSNTDFSSNSG